MANKVTELVESAVGEIALPGPEVISGIVFASWALETGLGLLSLLNPYLTIGAICGRLLIMTLNSWLSYHIIRYVNGWSVLGVTR